MRRELMIRADVCTECLCDLIARCLAVDRKEVSELYERIVKEYHASRFYDTEEKVRDCERFISSAKAEIMRVEREDR